MSTNTNSNSNFLERISDVVQEPLETLAPIDGYESVPLVSIDATIVPLTTLVPDAKGFVTAAKSRYNQRPPPGGLTIDEAASITLYTEEARNEKQNLYRVMNEVLRSKNREELPPWYLYMKLLLGALSHLPSVKKTVFRGIKSNVISEYEGKINITWWGFSSCSTKVNVLETFLGPSGPRTMFIVECKSGKDLRPFTSNPGEEEVLLLPETQFKVVACLNNGDGLHTIQLKEIRSPHNRSMAPSVIPQTNGNKRAIDCNGRACQVCGACCEWRSCNGTWRRRDGSSCKHQFNPFNHAFDICQCK